MQCLTDDDGRYSLNPFPGDSFSLRIFPADGQPYLVEKKGLTFSQSARLEADVALKRGVLVRGRVTESPSGKPVAGALVLHRPRKANNPFNKYGFQYYLDWYRDALTSAIKRCRRHLPDCRTSRSGTPLRPRAHPGLRPRRDIRR